MLKVYISLLGVVLTFIGYIPYVADVFKKKTTPHAFTWLIYSIVGFVGYELQLKGGAGVGSWTLLWAVIFCVVIFILSLKLGTRDIVRADIFFLVLAFACLFLWLVVKQPVWSAILATTTEILGFAPTVRKSWNKPHSETLSLYSLSFVRHAISIFALQKFNILTVLYPAAWAVANLLFTILLVIRRSVKKL